MNPTFDFSRITTEMDMDPEDILHLMTLYQTELKKDLRELEASLAGCDWPLIKGKLHKMKGDAANLCLNILAATFEKMEDSCADRTEDTLLTQLSSVKILEAQFNADFQKYAAGTDI